MNVTEIAKSIADELREHPERWTQGHISRDAHGNPLDYTRSQGACCWCIEGLYYRTKHLYGNAYPVYAGFISFSNALAKAVGLDPSEFIPSDWNDHAQRTVSDIIRACDRVAAGEGA